MNRYVITLATVFALLYYTIECSFTVVVLVQYISLAWADIVIHIIILLRIVILTLYYYLVTTYTLPYVELHYSTTTTRSKDVS